MYVQLEHITYSQHWMGTIFFLFFLYLFQKYELELQENNNKSLIKNNLI